MRIWQLNRIYVYNVYLENIKREIFGYRGVIIGKIYLDGFMIWNMNFKNRSGGVNDYIGQAKKK